MPLNPKPFSWTPHIEYSSTVRVRGSDTQSVLEKLRFQHAAMRAVEIRRVTNPNHPVFAESGYAVGKLPINATNPKP